MQTRRAIAPAAGLGRVGRGRRGRAAGVGRAGGAPRRSRPGSPGAELVGSVFDNYRDGGLSIVVAGDEQQRHQYALSDDAALQGRADQRPRLMRRGAVRRHGGRRRRRSRWKWNTTRRARYDNKCRRASGARPGPGRTAGERTANRRYARSDKYVSVGNI